MGLQTHDEIHSESSTQPNPENSVTTKEFENIRKNGEAYTSPEGESKEETSVDNFFQITIKLPHQPYEIQFMVSTQEQVQDLRQSIMESPGTFQYSCFHLELDEQRINDFVELSEVEGLGAGSEMKLVEDPYTEREARLHLIRIREIVGASGDKIDTISGISPGLSLHDSVSPWKAPDASPAATKTSTSPSPTKNSNALADYNFDSPPSIRSLLPRSQESPPKTLKSIGVSAWHPPPPFLRRQGHLLYLQFTTNEGEQYQVTSHISGFFVNKSSNSKFDPHPRQPPKDAAVHSLFSLISNLSPSFNKSFDALLDQNNKRDPLASLQFTHAIPSSPWLVSPTKTSLANHQADLTRTQETLLMSGSENTDNLRDWNEEIQATRELPHKTVQDRVFRERLISKTFAEFNDAATRGAVMVAHGEVAPLNPTESKDAQIFVYNNVFYSYGADGVGTFTSEGGDEAARVAVGKDVSGVKAVNQLDIAGLATPGTIIVDYLGKRLVAQSVVPGIFKQREPEEHQVDYGGVEGRDVVASNDAFVPTFSQMSKFLRVKKHPVWDKEGKRHLLEGSVETKGLLGTDGRKYILDLYRLTPLDILWLEEHRSDSAHRDSEDSNYPHRMTVLRPELVEAYWRFNMSEYVKQEVQKRKIIAPEKKEPVAIDNPREHAMNGEKLDSFDSHPDPKIDFPDQNQEQERVDVSAFSLALNPDVFCGQVPQTDDEKEEWSKDESEVRSACAHLRKNVLPEMLHDLKEGEIAFPMDGQSLSRLMHKRGINIRYLGKVAILAEEQDARMRALKSLAIQEMISRALKHVAHRYLKDLPMTFSGSCIAHLLNCLLGASLNQNPKPNLNEDLRLLYPDADFSYIKASPESLKAGVEFQVHLRYRFKLGEDWRGDIKHIQLLRGIALKLGLQLIARDYQFTPETPSQKEQSNPLNSGTIAPSEANGQTGGKKKRKNGARGSPPTNVSSEPPNQALTFSSDDIVNMVPIIKDACPKSAIAEEALEAGKLSMMQNEKETGQELLFESLTLHEQIYGIMHPEVARVYHQLAMLYYQLDQKDAAVELAHKAVIISERTLGVDSYETILSYLNLALFEHGNRNSAAAVSCVRHALELWKIIYGHKHPDSITTLNNAAVMLQQLKDYPASRWWFEASLAIGEEVTGKSSVNTATLLFQLAQALVLDGDPKGAVHRMRESYSIFLSCLGHEDHNTKEAEKWLEQLTQNAVSMAKHEKDAQSRQRIRKIFLNPRGTATLGTGPQPQVGQNPAELISGEELRRGLDARSIDELIRFIEGGGDVSKAPNKRTSRGNPKRRGGASATA